MKLAAADNGFQLFVLLQGEPNLVVWTILLEEFPLEV